jgi:uncharacterized protein YggU (UPF0235/DUF167 family)
MMAGWRRDEQGALVLTLHVTPGASRPEVAGTHGKTTTTSMVAALLDGKANAELPRFADVFDVPLRNVTLIRGETSCRRLCVSRHRHGALSGAASFRLRSRDAEIRNRERFRERWTMPAAASVAVSQIGTVHCASFSVAVRMPRTMRENRAIIDMRFARRGHRRETAESTFGAGGTRRTAQRTAV